MRVSTRSLIAPDLFPDWRAGVRRRATPLTPATWTRCTTSWRTGPRARRSTARHARPAGLRHRHCREHQQQSRTG